MPSWEALLTFSFASLILIAIPGPSVLFVIGRSLARGRRSGLLSVLGNELGSLLPMTAVAFGVGSIVAQSILLFTIVKIVGASYLIYLGIQAIRHRRDHSGGTNATEQRPPSGWVTLRQGFIVGATNPKTIVFFVAALPQFVDFHAGNVATQMMVLGLAFTVIAFVCDSIWAVLAGAAREWFASSDKRLESVRAAGGVMMVGLGGSLALTGNKA
ncbi:translocator [Mycolicibacterium mageritense DSM 44476 = CIP 104973]|uniref:Lysine transporter LysE n=1 Tax=Mycolicibacterium mageritense TaxID=53462 RepID=A0ABN5YGF7_MYCME|nr:LysE family translocator [Mycolicibacterium mageritense]MCC9186017.1 LysE family translocator [Mycolicibacterium mageritense]BBX36586.1 lysine transporter LysE [Mycolicibacterium mageritense]CDO24690.1 putative translocator [Mycolicibacterium mageritense DSM 44476 = CIP 104973]